MESEKIIATLSRTFSNSMSIQALFISAKLDVASLPVLTFPTTPFEYWASILNILQEKDPEGMKRLSKAAFKRYTGNSDLHQWMKELND